MSDIDVEVDGTMNYYANNIDCPNCQTIIICDGEVEGKDIFNCGTCNAHIEIPSNWNG